MALPDTMNEHLLTQALEKRETRYRTILSSVQDIVFTLDKAQRCTGVYGQWLERHHLAPEDFLGRSVQDIFGEEDSLAHREASDKAFRGESVVYE